MEGNPFINEQSGLPNYQLLLDRLNMSMAYSKRYHLPMAVCYLRIQPPKKNSEYSTFEIMQKCIKRMKASIRDIDTIANINGNDFIILLADINEINCHEILNGLISTINNHYSNEIDVTVNIGVCIFPIGAVLQEELLTLAKTQLFEAIEKGANQYSIYTGKLDSNAYRKVLIERDLPSAIKNNQLHLKYQPQLYLKEFEIKGVEALVRWNHPILGEVSPDEFIPVAEITGFISSIFFWSLEEICKNIHRFDGNMKVSINITIPELQQKNFKNVMLSYLEKYGVLPQYITLEITENHKISDVDRLSDIIKDLKSHNFTIALDDFGNGYFSFLDLIKLPVDIIKFDRQFVTSEGMVAPEQLNRSVKNLVEMAHHLSYKVVIEGIENSTQFKKWKNFNCDIIQGYYISKPKSQEDLIEEIKLIPENIKRNLHK
jgi:EAL domain-containing protein (putative c-di-GMP-specific phosphodiesterase class I)/GGDEF domain-containing protein